MAESSAPQNESSSDRKRSRRWLLEAGVVGAAYVGLTSFQTADLLANGTRAPAFATTDITGKEITLNHYHGRPMVLHFWATWCGVCRQELGMLNNFERDKGCLLALLAEEPSEAVVTFVRKHKLTYPVAYAPPGLVHAYRVSAYPTTYFLNDEHGVSSATVGMSTGLAMRARLSIAS